MSSAFAIHLITGRLITSKVWDFSLPLSSRSFAASILGFSSRTEEREGKSLLHFLYDKYLTH